MEQSRLFILSEWMISSLLLTTHVGRSQFVNVPEACRGFTCENNGTLLTEGSHCSCRCAHAYTGLQCETELTDSEWPDGPYATPMPIYGCPEGEGKGWKIGYINMTFVKATRSIAEASTLKRLTLLGPYSHNTIQMNFCFKSSKFKTSKVRKQDEHSADDHITPQVGWPSGNYMVYKAGQSCQQGFEEQELRLQLPPLLLVNTDGVLPEIEIIKNTTSATLRIQVCEKTHQAPFNVSESPWKFPFVLLPGTKNQTNGMTCPEFTNIDVLPESLELISPRYWSELQATPSSNRFSYCLYRKDVKQTGDSIGKEDVISLSHYHSYRFAPVWKVTASSEYAELYRDFPITGERNRSAFFGTTGKDGCQRYGMQCAKIPLSVFLESPNEPWILVDLEQTFYISFIQMDLFQMRMLPSKVVTVIHIMSNSKIVNFV